MVPTHLRPTFSESVSISIQNIEQDDGGKLSAEIRAKFDGERRNCDRLVLHCYYWVVWNPRGKLFRQQTCGLGQRNYNIVENVGEHEIPGKRCTLPETSNRPFDDMVILEGDESVCHCGNHRLPNGLKHLLIEDRGIVRDIRVYGIT